MKDLIFRNNKILAILAILILLAINAKSFLLILNSDLLGILISLCLFIIGGRKTNFKINYFLFAFILFLEFVSYRLNTKSVHFLAVILFLCLIFHYFTKRFSFIAFICIILFSTLFSTFFTHLTSEIKQGLCQVVFITLKNFMPIEKAEGVNFYINNAKITIDTACVGLSMFKTGLLSGAVLMTFEERKQQRYYGNFQILLFCFLIIILNIVSNYFRIVTLIIFNCTEENSLHHTIGLLCFVFYQILPILFLIRYLKPKFSQEITSESEIKPKSIILLLSFGVILVTSIKIINQENADFIQNLNSTYDTTKGEWLTDEVFKIKTKTKLTYIKTPSHNPLICWTGDGYKIVESKKIIQNKDEIWFNKIEKGNQKLNSYWWYECDKKRYTSLVEVLLLKLIYNRPIFLINETIEAQ